MQQLIDQWFDRWEKGDFQRLPISENFKHTSPFGVIEGKSAYINMVKENKEKFLGYNFSIHDAIYESAKACVRYTAQQGDDFKLEVTEWYYADQNQIMEIIAYYHIGEISEDRKIKDYQ